MTAECSRGAKEGDRGAVNVVAIVVVVNALKRCMHAVGSSLLKNLESTLFL